MKQTGIAKQRYIAITPSKEFQLYHYAKREWVAYWLFITDLGIDRDYVKQGIGSKLLKQAHELAGGEKNIIMYTCANENAVSFYEKNGMKASTDVMQRSEYMEWTEFTVK